MNTLKYLEMLFKKDSALLGLFLGVFVPIFFYNLQDLLIPLILGQPF